MATKTTKIEARKEYKTIPMGRGKGEYIEIGYFDGNITSFYESYPGMGGRYISGYIGCNAEATIKQLESCDWKSL